MSIDESYKIHYPSLKQMSSLKYTDPRVNTEGRKVHVEKEGSFKCSESSIHGHYIVYEDKGMPGSFIGIHVGSEINEDSGEAPINVIAIDKSRAAVVNRVQYRMRQSRVSENEETIKEVAQLKRFSGINEGHVTKFKKLEIGDTFKIPDHPEDAVLEKVSDSKYKDVTPGHEMRGVKNKVDDKNMEVIKEAYRPNKGEKRSRWMAEFERKVERGDHKLAGKIDWDTANHMYNIGRDVETAAKRYLELYGKPEKNGGHGHLRSDQI
jgi:hypothetical protein